MAVVKKDILNKLYVVFVLIVLFLVVIIVRLTNIQFSDGKKYRDLSEQLTLRNDTIYAVEIAQLCEKAGAKAIAIHGRTRSQMYTGKADWDIIRQVKESVNIPVIGNGDILTPEDAKRMIDVTNCDAVMIGRGVLGNPWLVKQTVQYLETGKYDKNINHNEKIKHIINHMDRLIDLKGEKIALLEMRSHAAWYIKGMKGATYVKREIAKVSTKTGLINIFEEYKKYLEKGPE